MSPKTLTGAELQLDDGPAREAELFLVDGNNLAYRAFFALPEELATSDGFSTNALLGFTNMLFKLLADYRRDYAVDVSSPGLERPLRTPAHFRGAVGRQVALRTSERKKKLRGEVVEAGERAVTVRAGDEALEIPYEAIVRGNLIYTEERE